MFFICFFGKVINTSIPQALTLNTLKNKTLTKTTIKQVPHFQQFVRLQKHSVFYNIKSPNYKL